jgi:hypothetical protein
MSSGRDLGRDFDLPLDEGGDLVLPREEGVRGEETAAAEAVAFSVSCCSICWRRALALLRLVVSFDTVLLLVLL